MALYQYVILSSALPGREEEFVTWYDKQHLADVQKVPGVVSARRFDVALQKVYDLDAPQYRSLAIYEVETDDPAGFLASISALSGTDAMPASDALSRAGMIQVLALAPTERKS